MATKICLVLTEETLEKNLKLLKKYKGYYDIAELRADLLYSNETFYLRKFPSMAKVPLILTCRRIIDGGKFKEGEGARLTLMAKALAFLDDDKKNNFAYVDFESEFESSALEEVARTYGIKIIRSYHNLKKPLSSITKELDKIRRTEDDIVKLATVVPTLKDFIPLFLQSQNSKKPYILSGLGRYGYLSRILANKIGSEIVYTFSEKYIQKQKEENALIDPITLVEKYRFRRTGESSKFYAVVGKNVRKSRSPEIQNASFKKKNISACYLPVSVDNFSEFFSFAKKINVSGMSVTAPFKKEAFHSANVSEGEAKILGVANTLLNKNGIWQAYNTDVFGFQKAITEFVYPEKIAEQKVAVLGAGGAAEAVCYGLHKLLCTNFKTNTQNDYEKNAGVKLKQCLKLKICIFNRTKKKAKDLALKYGFDCCSLLETDVAVKKLLDFNSLIINCTTAGACNDEDPIFFYKFNGSEKVYDLIYEPERTKLLQRAKKSGCKIANGYSMLKYQGLEQFKLFTDN